MDDIFTSTGRFVEHRDNGTNNIYIETAKGKYTLWSNFQTNVDRAYYIGFDKNSENREMVSKIASYYAKKIGISGVIGVNESTNKKAIAFYNPDDGSLNVNNINGGRIDSTLNDSNALMSALRHENNHKKDDKPGFVRTYTSHSKVYMNQILDPNFSQTPMPFQKGTVGSFANHIYNAMINGENNIYDLISNFNKGNSNWKVGTEFKSGYGYPIYYKGKELIVPTMPLNSPSE